ncbi:MAG: glutathione S-transferase family protein [Alphaproteobacteria bacterium]
MYKLIIGNKNYSSWSMRGWLVLAMTGAPFEEIVVPLNQGDWKARILSHSPAGKVPALVDGEITVWDSLAIAEYLHEKHDTARIWPEDSAARAQARAISAEMHSGFAALRLYYPMNMHRPKAPRPINDAGPAEDAARADKAVRADIARICAIWRKARAAFGAYGPYLFGEFCAADAMFAPVVSRFETFAVEVGPVETAYIETVLANDLFNQWRDGAMDEEWIIAREEVD